MKNVKARTNARFRRITAVIAAFIALLTCFALVMVIYNLIKANWLFAAAWFIAALLAASYVVIRVNTVFTTYLALEGGYLHMRNWTNEFLPYDYNNKLKIFSEFIPAKTKLVEIPVDEVAGIIIGTKNFIKRNIEPDRDFVKKIKPLERTRDFYRKKTVSSMDIFYVETYEGECCYMPIERFDAGDIKRIAQLMLAANANMFFKSGDRAYRTLKTPK